MATILINARGLHIVEPIMQDEALIIAQYAKNLHDSIMRQLATQNGQPQYPAEFAPRQLEPNSAEPDAEAA